MAFNALNWVADLPIRDMKIKAVLSALANRRNVHSGRCDPSMARLATDVGCSSRTVIRILKRMVAMDLLLEIERRPGGTNQYEINFDWFEPVENPDLSEGTPDKTSVAPLTNRVVTPDKIEGTPDTAVTQTLKPHENLSENHQFGGFAEGWKTLRRALASVEGCDDAA